MGGVSRRAWLMFAVMSLLWGIPYLFIKVAVAEVAPVTVVFLRTALAALVLLPVALRRGALRRLRGRWTAVVVLALMEITAPFLLIAYGERHITSSLTGLLIAAEPLLVALLAFRLDPSERVTGVRLIGLLVGMVGVVALLGLDAGGDRLQLLGAGMVLLATLGYAGGVLLVKRAFADVPPLGVVTAALGITAVLLAPFAAVKLPDRVPSAAVVGSLAALAVVCTAVAFLVFFALIAEAGPSRTTVFTYVNPAVAVALGVTLLHEPLTGVTVAGFLLVIAGSWLSTGGSLPPAALAVLTAARRRRTAPHADPASSPVPADRPFGRPRGDERPIGPPLPEGEATAATSVPLAGTVCAWRG